MYKRVLVAFIVLVGSLVLSVPGWAAPHLQARSVITYPSDGMTVSGVVDVTGIATHPNLSFYQLRYASGAQETADSQWIDFAIVPGQPVDNDVLGSWDTTVIPDGQYTLALAVWGENDGNSPYVVFVRRVTVNNAQPVPSPTSDQPTETPEPAPTVPAGPSPTPIPVELPATSTPRPSVTPISAVEENTTEVADGTGDEPILDLDVSELQDAFCAGGTISMVLLGGWGFYLLLKAIVRWYLRERVGPPR
jgi:hypothetical protein